jgi:hypothetical protein
MYAGSRMATLSKNGSSGRRQLTVTVGGGQPLEVAGDSAVFPKGWSGI